MFFAGQRFNQPRGAHSFQGFTEVEAFPLRLASTGSFPRKRQLENGVWFGKTQPNGCDASFPP
jgi:hypothetical protein